MEDRLVYSDELGGELIENMSEKTLVEIGHLDEDELDEEV